MDSSHDNASIVLVMNNIRSVYNVGSLFRTADASGVAHIVLVGYTPAPIDRFGRDRSDLAKVALGAEKTIPWIEVPTLREATEALRKEDYHIAALEQSPDSTPLFSYVPPEKIALILGNEPGGLSSEELSLTDTILEIPMLGKKESLNVSVAAGIALFALQHQCGML